MRALKLKQIKDSDGEDSKSPHAEVLDPPRGASLEARTALFQATGPAPRLVSVLVPVAVATPYSYRVPPELSVAPGDIVTVPLGTREAVGVVWDDPADEEIGHTRLPGHLSPISLRQISTPNSRLPPTTSARPWRKMPSPSRSSMGLQARARRKSISRQPPRRSPPAGRC